MVTTNNQEILLNSLKVNNSTRVPLYMRIKTLFSTLCTHDLDNTKVNGKSVR